MLVESERVDFDRHAGTLQLHHVHLTPPLEQPSVLEPAGQKRRFHKELQLREAGLVRSHLEPLPCKGGDKKTLLASSRTTSWLIYLDPSEKTETVDGSVLEEVALDGAVDGVGVGGVAVGFFREAPLVQLRRGAETSEMKT